MTTFDNIDIDTSSYGRVHDGVGVSLILSTGIDWQPAISLSQIYISRLLLVDIILPTASF